MAFKREKFRMLIPSILTVLITFYAIAWWHNMLNIDLNLGIIKKQLPNAVKKMWSNVQENSTLEKSFKKINVDRINRTIISLDNMPMSVDGRCSENNDSKRYEVVPQKNSWITRQTCKPFKGPYYIKLENGKEVPYTNYTFMPLTFHSKYILNNPNICEDLPQNLTFLILVHSAVQHFDKRKALRETWSNPMLLKEHISRLVFIVGKTYKSFVQRHLEDEERVHNDIVQGDFIDDYHNLTHKAVLGHRWIQEHCQNTKFVLKIDDDVVINIVKVIEDLLPVFSHSNSIIACRIRKSVPVDRQGKWAISNDYFPGYVNYPFEFCPGAFALMPLQTSLSLFRASHVTPFLWLDDVYVYGILVKIAHITLRHTDGLYNWEKGATKCFEGKRHCPMLIVLTLKPEQMYFLWKQIVKQYKDLYIKYSHIEILDNNV
ncbi:hypothetical protein ACJMK2_015778 [Sinanodonta woodiana]|uniref:Hexosyltransferase n=1 Tax=Sinanodonta woodiana TaxID=1069815 RepID=A0ABD3URI6_SINWO